MKRIVLLPLLSLLLFSPFPAVLHAADEGPVVSLGQLSDADLDGLNGEEQTYVRSLYGANSAAQYALMNVIATDEEISDPQNALIESDEYDLLDAVTKCQQEMKAAVEVFRQPAPDSMQVTGQNSADAANLLDGAFSTCLPLLRGELRGHVSESLSNPFASFLPPGPEDRKRVVDIARARACVRKEAEESLVVLQAFETEMLLEVEAIQEEQELGESILEALIFDQCFIATAAYGTNTAAEIDVLRSFRDEVLAMSPAGRDLTAFYYAASPPIADFIARHEVLRTVVREGVVDPIVRLVSFIAPVWRAA